MKVLDCFGAGRSTIIRRLSARHTASGARRRSVTRTSVSASPGLITEHFYKFANGHLPLFGDEIKHLCIFNRRKRVGAKDRDLAAEMAVEGRSPRYEGEGREHGLVAG